MRITINACGENQIQPSLISSGSAGATPAAAPNRKHAFSSVNPIVARIATCYLARWRKPRAFNFPRLTTHDPMRSLEIETVPGACRNRTPVRITKGLRSLIRPQSPTVSPIAIRLGAPVHNCKAVIATQPSGTFPVHIVMPGQLRREFNRGRDPQTGSCLNAGSLIGRSRGRSRVSGSTPNTARPGNAPTTHPVQ